MTNDLYKREMNHKIGKGGYHCYCCGPSSTKHKKLLRHIARSRIKSWIRKEVAEF